MMLIDVWTLHIKIQTTKKNNNNWKTSKQKPQWRWADTRGHVVAPCRSDRTLVLCGTLRRHVEGTRSRDNRSRGQDIPQIRVTQLLKYQFTWRRCNISFAHVPTTFSCVCFVPVTFPHYMSLLHVQCALRRFFVAATWRLICLPI